MKIDFSHLNDILKKDKDFITLRRFPKNTKLTTDQKNLLIKITSRIKSKVPEADTLAINAISIIEK